MSFEIKIANRKGKVLIKIGKEHFSNEELEGLAANLFEIIKAVFSE